MKIDLKSEKVVLLIANTRWYDKRPWLNLPYASLILTALLKDEFNFSIIDANAYNLSEGECGLMLKKINPSVVLTTAMSVEYHKQYHAVVSIAKDACPECITVMGGVYPTVLGEEAIKDKNLDYVFMGHAEERLEGFLKLIIKKDISKLVSFSGIGFKNKDGNTIINPVNSYIVDVKDMVKPDYSLVDLNQYLQQNTLDFHFNSDKPTATVITSYGCLFNCVFCASRTVCGRGVVFRPVKDVLEEIDYLVNTYGVKNLIFLDDCFMADRKRVETILNAILERKYELKWKVAALTAWLLDDELLELMKKAGCTQVNISVESGSQNTLDNIIHKPLKLEIIPGLVSKCKTLGIDITASFVIGFPGETWRDIRETFSYAEKCDFDLVHFHIANPLPKTDLYKIAKEKELLPKDFNFMDLKVFGYGYGFITTDEFTPFELMVLRSYEWDRINFKTEEKTAKIARMLLTTVDELNEHRRNTRRKLGIHY